jgi:hypothetical protein
MSSPKKAGDGSAPKAAAGSKLKTTTAGPRATLAMSIGSERHSEGKVLKPTQKANSVVKSVKSSTSDPLALSLPSVPSDGSELLAEVCLFTARFKYSCFSSHSFAFNRSPPGA